MKILDYYQMNWVVTRKGAYFLRGAAFSTVQNQAKEQKDK